MYEPFLTMCVLRPQFGLLQRAYETYLGNSAPCQRGITNQCAIRMSIALGRAGFGLEGFQPRNRVHSGDRRCGTDGMSHVAGANELALWLRSALGRPQVIRPERSGGGCAHAFEQLRGHNGIVYFNNCFRREGSTAQSGDHIDLFNGRQYYNQILHPHAGGDETTGGSLFGRADEVWFWELT